jgi:dTDP-4-amino-4,6-dideoxygalactose transaminase
MSIVISSTIKRRPADRIRDLPVWPELDDEMVDAAARVLKSGKLNYWTGGEGRLFEREMAGYLGCEHAIAVANGTVALELALIALGIGAGDEVVVPSRTFVATASAVARCGATPVFAEIDLDSQNLTPRTIAEQLSARTRAVIAVHLAGWPCDMAPRRTVPGTKARPSAHWEMWRRFRSARTRS